MYTQKLIFQMHRRIEPGNDGWDLFLGAAASSSALFAGEDLLGDQTGFLPDHPLDLGCEIWLGPLSSFCDSAISTGNFAPLLQPVRQ
jgi:hypothetical protein